MVAVPVVPGAALEQSWKARELTFAVRQTGRMEDLWQQEALGHSTSSVKGWGGSQRTLPRVPWQI